MRLDLLNTETKALSLKENYGSYAYQCEIIKDTA